jgi:hypothetical protein
MPGLDQLFYGFTGAIVLVYLIIPMFPLLYVIIRWRAAGSGEPGLGTYAGVLYFRSVAVLVLVSGVALLLHSIVSAPGSELPRAVAAHDDSMEELRRVAGGMLVGGVLIWGMQLAILARARFSTSGADARRVFHGFVMIIAGLASVGTIMALCIQLFQEDTEFDDLRELIVWAGVWTGTYLVQVALLRRGAVESSPDSTAPPATPVD